MAMLCRLLQTDTTLIWRFYPLPTKVPKRLFPGWSASFRERCEGFADTIITYAPTFWGSSEGFEIVALHECAELIWNLFEDFFGEVTLLHAGVKLHELDYVTRG